MLWDYTAIPCGRHPSGRNFERGTLIGELPRYSIRSMKRILLLFSCAGVWAQSLQVLPSPISKDEYASFQLMIVAPPGKEVTALQWMLSVPRGVAIAPSEIRAGKAAEGAGKSITCALKGESKETGASSFACILAGGKNAIPNGSIAAVRCKAGAGLHSATVRVHDILGVSADLKQVNIADAEGTIRWQ